MIRRQDRRPGNTQALLANRDWQTFGAHRVVLYRDWPQEFKDLAALIDLDAIEKDSAPCDRAFACCDGMVVQHEIDHLDGVLVTDRVEVI